MDKMREEFEAWYSKELGFREDNPDRMFSMFCDDGETHEYYRLGVRTAWLAWKASRVALSENHSPDTAKMVQDGWQLVPKVPTREMIEQGNAAMAYDCCSGDASDAYQAMLAATPKLGSE